MDENRNTSWWNNKASWFIYSLGIGVFHLVISSLPDMSTETAWNVTFVTHAVASWLAFHWEKGAHFIMLDEQGKQASLTQWEQLDDGVQFTPTRKFLTIVPIVLYVLTTHHTDYHRMSLYTNTLLLFVLLLSKVPSMHKVRVLGINK